MTKIFEVTLAERIDSDSNVSTNSFEHHHQGMREGDTHVRHLLPFSDDDAQMSVEMLATCISNILVAFFYALHAHNTIIIVILSGALSYQCQNRCGMQYPKPSLIVCAYISTDCVCEK